MADHQRPPISQTIFIALFIALVFLPGVQQYTRVVPIEPVVESRAKVPLPPGNPPLELWRGEGYFSAYERHFNDVFGFRDVFIRLRNQIQFSLFHDSNQVVLGSDGWLTDKSAVELEQRHVDALGEGEWLTLQRRLVRLNALLKRRGITFLVVPVPLKNTVYPEKFPASTARRPAVTGYERLRRLLAANHVPFVDAYAVLTERRRTVDAYYHTDLHWNTAGARAVAVETVRTLARSYHSPVTWQYPDRYTMQPFAGGVENTVLATFWPVRDIEPFEEQPGPCGAITSDGEVETYVNHCPGPKLPPALLIGNSFAHQMIGDGLPNHFSTMYLTSDLNNFGKLLTMIPPGTRIVIWELFELEIGYQMQADAWWQQDDERR